MKYTMKGLKRNMKTFKKNRGYIKMLGIIVWVKFFKNQEQAKVWSES